ncbi:hypothetical protein UF75_0115 [Desulfosporosinus sp. I2]|nr:hypothetical protein UF75_0115 [Desulfosporosinus sp. I2]
MSYSLSTKKIRPTSPNPKMGGWKTTTLRNIIIKHTCNL